MNTRLNRLKRYSEAFLLVGWLPAILMPIILVVSTWVHMMKFEKYAACVASAQLIDEKGMPRKEDDEYTDYLEVSLRIFLIFYLVAML